MTWTWEILGSGKINRGACMSLKRNIKKGNHSREVDSGHPKLKLLQ